MRVGSSRSGRSRRSGRRFRAGRWPRLARPGRPAGPVRRTRVFRASSLATISRGPARHGLDCIRRGPAVGALILTPAARGRVARPGRWSKCGGRSRGLAGGARFSDEVGRGGREVTIATAHGGGGAVLVARRGVVALLAVVVFGRAGRGRLGAGSRAVFFVRLTATVAPRHFFILGRAGVVLILSSGLGLGSRQGRLVVRAAAVTTNLIIGCWPTIPATLLLVLTPAVAVQVHVVRQFQGVRWWGRGG